MAHPFHHALSSAKKWGGAPEDYLLLHQYMDQSKAADADFRHRAASPSLIRHIHARTAFWTRHHNLHRPHRSCPIHRRTTCDTKIWAGFQHLPIGPAASARNRGWAARSRFISRSIPSRTPLRQKDHDNVCDLSPPPPPRRRELACRRPRRRLAISAARTPRRLQTASTARLLPDNDRASHQSSVARARVSPLTPAVHKDVSTQKSLAPRRALCFSETSNG